MPSPDGKTILFESNRNGKWALYLSNADGKNQRLIDDDDNPVVTSWSPDGQRIAFAVFEVMLINPLD